MKKHKDIAFKEVKASKKSLAFRRLIYGVGINDADYMTNPKINNKTLTCPYYKTWHQMLTRCYHNKYQRRSPTYTGCSVCVEWLYFSNFKSWMIKQDWQEKELDKDIIKTGNKVYSPETCIFVTRKINSLLGDNATLRGHHPQGVHFCKRDGVFIAGCSINGKKRHIGTFKTSEAASIAYREFKSNHFKEVALKQDEPLKTYLIRIANEINY